MADTTSIRVAPAGQAPDPAAEQVWTPAGTDHAVTLTGLDVSTAYWAHIKANESTDAVVWFNTSNVIDETPPEMLNLAAEVLEDGRVTVSWYTSESATESILIDGASVHEDAFATKKNHVFTTDVLGDGTYALEVISADASGNGNQSTLSFTVDVGASPTDDSDTQNTPVDEPQPAAEVSNTTLQLVALIVVALVLLAFLRGRGHEPDGDDPWQ